MMRGARVMFTIAALLAALSVVGLEIVQACGGGGCQEDWTAESRPAHSGCAAGPISAGLVSYAGSTLWRHHNAPYTKGSNSDLDCRQNADCSFTDVAEDTFTCDWKIQRYENGDWVDVGTISGGCAGANWDTTAYQPGKEYRAKSGTNDTSADGPYGDDVAAAARYSAGQMMWAPTPQSFDWFECIHRPCDGGTLHVEYTWTSSCGHVAHLDKVTVREKVTYEPAYTSGGTHFLSHPNEQQQPANCFTSEWDDPTRAGGLATGGRLEDNHLVPSMNGTWASYCQASQKYQWATGWPDPPSRYNEGADWHDFAGYTYTISRYVENIGTEQNPNWQYRITKGAWECTD